MTPLAFDPHHQRGTPPKRCTVLPARRPPRAQSAAADLPPTVPPWIREEYSAAAVILRQLAINHPSMLSVMRKVLEDIMEDEHKRTP